MGRLYIQFIKNACKYVSNLPLVILIYKITNILFKIKIKRIGVSYYLLGLIEVDSGIKGNWIEVNQM